MRPMVRSSWYQQSLRHVAFWIVSIYMFLLFINSSLFFRLGSALYIFLVIYVGIGNLLLSIWTKHLSQWTVQKIAGLCDWWVRGRGRARLFVLLNIKIQMERLADNNSGSLLPHEGHFSGNIWAHFYPMLKHYSVDEIATCAWHGAWLNRLMSVKMM